MFSASSVKTTLNLSIDLMLVMFDFKPAKIKREFVCQLTISPKVILKRWSILLSDIKLTIAE